MPTASEDTISVHDPFKLAESLKHTLHSSYIHWLSTLPMSIASENTTLTLQQRGTTEEK